MNNCPVCTLPVAEHYNKLKCCPSCPDSNVYVKYEDPSQVRQLALKWFYVKCGNCDYETSKFSSKKLAIAEHNTRAGGGE